MNDFKGASYKFYHPQIVSPAFQNESNVTLSEKVNYVKPIFIKQQAMQEKMLHNSSIQIDNKF